MTSLEILFYKQEYIHFTKIHCFLFVFRITFSNETYFIKDYSANVIHRVTNRGYSKQDMEVFN